MILSQILMVISLVVLAFIIWQTMSSAAKSNPTGKAVQKAENFGQQEKNQSIENFQSFAPMNEISRIPVAPYPAPNPKSGDVSDVIINYSTGSSTNPNSVKNISELSGTNDGTTMEPNYKVPEGFESGGNVFSNPPYTSNNNLSGIGDSSNSSSDVAPYSAPTVPSDGTTQVEDVNDVYKVEGTDFLSAPLADRFYYTNSIANVNRNASHDFRGDIPTPYNDKLTPFYQSAIYGEPMTINRLSDCAK